MEDHLNITRPDQLQALGDPTRWRILGRLSESPPPSRSSLARSVSRRAPPRITSACSRPRASSALRRRSGSAASSRSGMRASRGSSALTRATGSSSRRQPATRISRTCRSARRWQRHDRAAAPIPTTRRCRSWCAPGCRSRGLGDLRSSSRRWRKSSPTARRTRERRSGSPPPSTFPTGRATPRAQLDVARDADSTAIRRGRSWRPP